MHVQTYIGGHQTMYHSIDFDGQIKHPCEFNQVSHSKWALVVVKQGCKLIYLYDIRTGGLNG